MGLDIIEEGPGALDEYARIPISFEVCRVLDVDVLGGGLGGVRFTERSVARPYLKNYDALDGGPAEWPGRFDVSNWGIFAAMVDGERVGGAVVAFDTDDVAMLEERSDLAVLWDLRVAPEVRGRGIGSMLFQAAMRWAGARGCRQLKTETQNINLGACRFYARMGCELGGIHRFAYPDLPNEVQLLWYASLEAGTSAAQPD